MIINKNMSALLRGITKACDVAMSMEDVSMSAIINDIVEHVETIQHLTMLGGKDTVALTKDGEICINEGTGWPVEGKNLQRCLYEPYLYAHGTTLFDIRYLRRELGFKKEEYADDHRMDCSSKERIIMALIAAANERGIKLSDAIYNAQLRECMEIFDQFFG